MPANILEETKAKLRSAGLGADDIDFIQSNCKSLDVVNAVADGWQVFGINGVPFEHIGRYSRNLIDLATSEIPVDIIEATISAQDKLNPRWHYSFAGIALHAKSADVINAVANRVDAFTAAGVEYYNIVAIALGATSVEVVNAVADRAADFKAVNFNANGVVELAKLDKPIDIINAVIDNLQCFGGANIDFRDVIHLARNATSVEQVNDFAAEAKDVAALLNAAAALTGVADKDQKILRIRFDSIPTQAPNATAAVATPSGQVGVSP